MIRVLTLDHLSFASPPHLLALLVVPLLFAFAIVFRRRRVRDRVLFTNLSLLEQAGAVRRRRWWLGLPVVLMALALATAAAAFARPQIRLVTTQRGATLLLLADVSGSMQATDIHPERIYAAADAMRAFVGTLPASAKVGLITFSDNVEVLDAPTTDHIAIDNGLDVLAPEGGTALGDGVATAVRVLVESLAAAGTRHQPGQYLPAGIVLESDGAQNRGGVSPFAAAQEAKRAGIRIYGVALGTRRGYVSEGSGLMTRAIPVPPDPGTVAMLARVSGGQAFDATSSQSLDSIYRHLGSTLVRHRDASEISSWVDLASAVLLLSGVTAARLRGGALP
jgi:Ca-activated chloride channel family protein